MSDYCMFPNQCGIGANCSACMGQEISRLKSRIAELEAQATTHGYIEQIYDSEVKRFRYHIIKNLDGKCICVTPRSDGAEHYPGCPIRLKAELQQCREELISGKKILGRIVVEHVQECHEYLDIIASGPVSLKDGEPYYGIPSPQGDSVLDDVKYHGTGITKDGKRIAPSDFYQSQGGGETGE